MTGLRLVWVFLALVFGLTLRWGISTSNASACTFILGFQAIHDQIPDIVGDCLVDQHYDPVNGDALQETTGGLLVWRKADNLTAFTDGYRSWVNGPYGLQERLNTERFDWDNNEPATPVLTPPRVPTPTPTTTAVPSYAYVVVPSHAVQQVRPGGAQTISARLSAPNAPPVFGAIATFKYADSTYTALTQPPDGSAWVTVATRPRPGGGENCFGVTMVHNSQTYIVPGWEQEGLCWQFVP